MTFKNYLKSKNGQSVLEYCILFAVMLAALIASLFMTNVGAIFTGHFIDCRTIILGG